MSESDEQSRAGRRHTRRPGEPVLPVGMGDEGLAPLRVDRLVEDENGAIHIENLGALHRVQVPNLQRLEFAMAGLPSQWDEATMRDLIREVELLEGEGTSNEVRRRMRRLRQELLAPLADTIISQRDVIAIQHQSSVEREQRVCEAMMALREERDAALQRLQEQSPADISYALVCEMETMAAQAQEIQEVMNASEARRREREGEVVQLVAEREALLDRIMQEGPRAAIDWARAEVLSRIEQGIPMSDAWDLSSLWSHGGPLDEEGRPERKKRRVQGGAAAASGKRKDKMDELPMMVATKVGGSNAKMVKGAGGLTLAEGLITAALEAVTEELWHCMGMIYEKGLPTGILAAPIILYQGSNTLLSKFMRSLCYRALICIKRHGGFPLQYV